MSRRHFRVRRLLILGLVLLLAPSAGALGRKPYRDGDRLRFTGRVTDAAGAPISGVSVLLEVSRLELRLLRWRRERTGTLQVPATTAADGSYAIDWRWDDYYDTFNLVVALPVRRDAQETYQEFHRVDVTDTVRAGAAAAGAPLDVAIEVAGADLLRGLKRFVDGIAGEDEQRVYREMGLPDRIDAGQADYDPDSSWWYFEAGKVFRFEGGELERVEHFDPILPEPGPAEP